MIEHEIRKQCGKVLPYRYFDPESEIVVKKAVSLPVGLTRWEKFLCWCKEGSLFERLFRRVCDLTVSRQQRGFQVISGDIMREMERILEFLVDEEEAYVGHFSDCESVLDIRGQYDGKFVCVIQQGFEMLGKCSGMDEAEIVGFSRFSQLRECGDFLCGQCGEVYEMLGRSVQCYIQRRERGYRVVLKRKRKCEEQEDCGEEERFYENDRRRRMKKICGHFGKEKARVVEALRDIGEYGDFVDESLWKKLRDGSGGKKVAKGLEMIDKFRGVEDAFSVLDREPVMASEFCKGMLRNKRKASAGFIAIGRVFLQFFQSERRRIQE